MDSFDSDMILRRGTGEPKELLKAINPREAQLLDAAAGAHIRFRLGGSSWPPLILYKIFTHRPVTGRLKWNNRVSVCSVSNSANQAWANIYMKSHQHTSEVKKCAMLIVVHDMALNKTIDTSDEFT
jgi:hypothetical protein